MRLPLLFPLSWMLSLAIAFSPAHAPAAEALYQNPVIPGDYPDPSVIRVGNDFWATATSSEWGPQFPILHSTDLVNWDLAGSVFPHRPQWAVANFWAPEISEHRGKYFVYYVGRKKGGPLAVSVATADQPAGPYTDHGPLVAQPAGSIDPVPVTDEKGKRFLIWKEDGNSRRLPAILWLQPLSDDGLKLVDEPREILRNDAPWEGAVVEGPFVVHRGDWFYLFYSGNGCCGRGCSYAMGVARAKSLLGPWEKNSANPILAGNEQWKCPGHGSITDDGKGHYWLLYHAYSATDFIYTGREALLDEVKFREDHWPEINDGRGPSAVSLVPFAAIQQRNFGAKRRYEFVDEFTGKLMSPGWQWPQENEPKYEFATNGSPGFLLRPNDSKGTNLLAAILARSTTSGDYEATVILENPDGGVAAGIAVVGDEANATGLAVLDGKLILWRRDKGTQKVLAETAAPAGGHPRLQLKAGAGHIFRFAGSADGKSWMEIGDPQSGDQMPPWDRSIRVGLTVGGRTNAAAHFDRFEMRAQ